LTTGDSRWSLRALADEAFCNVLGPGSHNTAVVLCALLFGASLGTMFTIDQDRLASRREASIQVGYNVVIIDAVSNDGNGGIVADSCRHLPRTTASGAVVTVNANVHVLQTGPVPMQLTFVDGLFRSSLTAPIAALPTNIVLPGLQRVTIQIDDSVRAYSLAKWPLPAPVGLDGNVLIPTVLPPGSLVKRCLAVVELKYVESAETLNLIAGSVRAFDSQPDVRFGTDGTSPVRVASDFLQRPQRLAPLFVGLFLGLLLALTHRTRVRELDAYRAVGTSNTELLVLLALENLLIAGFLVLGSVTPLLLGPIVGLESVSFSGLHLAGAPLVTLTAGALSGVRRVLALSFRVNP